MKIRIGTRGSRLALAQAEWVRDRLREQCPQDKIELIVIRTKGDRILNRPLTQIGGKGVFVREIETKLLQGEIDLAVHSMKDMPVNPAEGLAFTKTWPREDARDVLLLREADSLANLPEGAVIGTGSLRRKLQLQKLRPDIKVVDIRGNVDTRLQKMGEEKLDGIVLAAAGLHRLGMRDVITQYLEPTEMVPAPAQGVLAIEVRENDRMLQEKCNQLADRESHVTAQAEREFLRLSGGDCHMSVGAFCEKERDDNYVLRCLLGEEQLEVRGEEAGVLPELAMQRFRRSGQESVENENGMVYLVGAGPGDVGLMTVKGRELIRKADCILYDRLAAPELLEDTRKNCEKIYVGKENHHHTMSQEEIQSLLVEKAREGKTVVRLKGGDPYVFGRGGEEALALRNAGIPYETVPGVTSAVAALAAADMPVTHRGLAGGFRVLTAHDQRDQLAELDFHQLAKSKDTLVFLMGLGKLEEIMQKLLDAGMSPEKPAAVISHGTMPDQQVCVGTVADLAERVRGNNFTSPAVIVVGEVAALRESLHVPRYLVVKIGENPSELASLLSRKGALVEEVSVGKIVYHTLPLTKEKLSETDWLLFTSRHGVEGFFQSLDKAGLDSRALANCRVAAVGAKTAETLRERGICPDYVPEKASGKTLVQGLRGLVKREESVCNIRAEVTAGNLRETLESMCRFEEAVVYSNIEVPISLPRNPEQYDNVFFTCGSSASRLIQSVKGNIPARWQNEDVVLSIGPGCTKVLREMGVRRIREAEEASYEGLASLV